MKITNFFNMKIRSQRIFSDRPDFQRMLHDVQDGKIKAIVCYKLDRVGRKTADLIRLMDFLGKCTV